MQTDENSVAGHHPGADQGIGAQDKAERVFLALLSLHNNHNINVSASSAANNYAPKVFSRHDRNERLSTQALTRAMTALLILMPGTPMLFQGQEFGATTPFLYFADHKSELAAAVR